MLRFAFAKRGGAAFTLVEILVSISVLVLLVVVMSKMLSLTSGTATMAYKHMDSDTQARSAFDRLAVDLSQLINRPDSDVFLKSTALPQTGNDQIAFFCKVPGYGQNGLSSTGLSLVAYRIADGSGSSLPYQLQRMGQGLTWEGDSATDSQIPFLPLTISEKFPNATNANADNNYELIGPQIFRFEYGYLLKRQILADGTSLPPLLSSNPKDTRLPTPGTGLKNVSALVVTIAVIDPRSRTLLTDQQLAGIIAQMRDFVGSSRVDLQACKLEYSIVSPK